MGLKVRLGLAAAGLALSSMFGVNMLAGVKVSCDWSESVSILTSDWSHVSILTSDWSHVSILSCDWLAAVNTHLQLVTCVNTDL